MPTAQLSRMLATAREEYKAMIFAMCEGEEFPDAQLRETTLAAGFGMTDLERHLSLAKARYRAAVTDRKALAEKAQEISTAQTRADNLVRDIHELETKFTRERDPLLGQLAEARELATHLRQESQELRRFTTQVLHDTLPPGWQAGLVALEKQREDVLGRIPPLFKRRGELEAELKKGKSLQYQLESADSREERAKLEKELAAYRSARSQFRTVNAQYRAVQKEVKQLDAEIRQYAAGATDWRCCEFLTGEEDAARRVDVDRRRARYRNGVGAPVLIGD